MKGPSKMSEQERVQKILAKAGIASRRKCEELIVEGSVTINGKTAKLGDKAEFGKDAIKVNGKLLRQIEDKVYFAFYKPRAVISMLVDQDNRPSIAEYLGKIKYRVFPIGRLDFNSEGLIILTNDGDFAEKMQKRDDIPRVYVVKVKGKADADTIKRLEKGARLEYRMVRPHSVRILRELESKSEIQIVILGGGAIDIRALCEMKGLLVDRITRTAIGHLTLRGLAAGHYRMLKPSQAESLLENPELGLKLLDQEEESEKPKGQRNFHAKKTIIDPLLTPVAPTPAAVSRLEAAARRMQRTTRAAHAEAASPVKPLGGKPASGPRPFNKTSGGKPPMRSDVGKSRYGAAKDSRDTRESRTPRDSRGPSAPRSGSDKSASAPSSSGSSSGSSRSGYGIYKPGRGSSN